MPSIGCAKPVRGGKTKLLPLPKVLAPVFHFDMFIENVPCKKAHFYA